MYNHKAKTFAFIFIICIAIIIYGLPAKSWSLDGADVGVYNDTSYSGGGSWEEGIIAIKEMLNFYGYSYEDITPDNINHINDLDSFYKVLVYGGGWAGGYNEFINGFGYNNIRKFVRNGGGYFGICAGSYFASDVVMWKQDFETPVEIYNYEYPLNLFKGVARGAVLGIKKWTSTTGCSSGITHGAEMTKVNINNSILPDISSELRILYYGGPFFVPYIKNKWKITVVATYEVPGAPADGKPAMILFPYGKGKVFLTGPHPEISFDNCSLYYDNETWELMNSIFSLLMEN